MRLVVISDAHLLGPDDPEQRALCALLDGLEADALVLLGDLMHAGWTWAGLPHPDHAPLFASLERVLRRGTGVSWVPGNHDFGVRPALDIQVLPSHRVDCDGLRLLLAHGDEPDTSPSYRALSAALRGRAFRRLIDSLGPERGMGLLRRIAGPRHGPELSPPQALVDAQRAWAAEALIDETLDGVVMGHSHVLGEIALPEGRLWHTGAWLHLRSWLDVVDGVAQLRTGAASAHAQR